MAAQTVIESLRKLPFLQDAADDELNELAKHAELKSGPAGAIIFREGEAGDKFYFVVEGAVSLEMKLADGKAKRIQTVGPNELLGWSPLLRGGGMKATARAIKPTRLLCFDAPATLALCDQKTRVGSLLLREIAHALAERLHATRLYLLEVSHHHLPDAVPHGSHEGAD